MKTLRGNKTGRDQYIHNYQPGDIVLVVRGPFRGQEGQVTAIGYETVEIGWPRGELFGRVSAKIERIWFRPENIHPACPRCCR